MEARAADHKFLGSLAYRDKNTFLRLYKVYARPHLQYCSSAWSPYTVADKEVLENVQRIENSNFPAITNLLGRYKDNSEQLNTMIKSVLSENLSSEGEGLWLRDWG